jgi:hypothetical protein
VSRVQLAVLGKRCHECLYNGHTKPKKEEEEREALRALLAYIHDGGNKRAASGVRARRERALAIASEHRDIKMLYY